MSNLYTGARINDWKIFNTSAPATNSNNIHIICCVDMHYNQPTWTAHV